MPSPRPALPLPAATEPAGPDAAPGAPARAGRAPRVLSYVESLTPHLFTPTPARPVRAKHRALHADTQVRPHSHPWAQMAISTTGVLRLTVAHGTYIVPPSRALWIPPGVEHAVTMIEDADLRTLYFLQPPGRCGPGVARAEEAPWRQCRVLEVSALLRALVLEMPGDSDDAGPPTPEVRHRERHLSALILDELRRASPVRLGVDLPRDKRLRHLCEAVIADPTRHDTLIEWAHDSGASPRTVARLFRQELGMTFTQWRQQVILARAVALAAGRRPINQIAAELGYNSPSAFSAMVRRSVGLAPGRFLGSPQDLEGPRREGAEGRPA